MSNPPYLKFDPCIAAAPIYVGGASIESIKKEYGLDRVIKMASNESPLGPSPLAIEAIQQAATGLNRYPPMGDEDLRAALADSVGQEMTPDNFFTGNGVCDVLAMIAFSFLKPGEECIICRPTFPVYDITASRVGATVVYVNLNSSRFVYDVEAILAAVTAQTRLVYLCTPNNPTGGTIGAEQMETLVNHMPPHILIVIDEVYHHFATTNDFPNSLAYVRQGKNVVVLHSFSKAFSLAGLRLGYAITPPEVARYLSRSRQSFHLNQLAVVGGIASLQDKAHLEKTVAITVAGRDWLYDQLLQLDIRVWPSQSNFILFKPPFAPAVVSERLLRRGVIVRPMNQFYLPTHLRVSVGLPEENERFIAVLRESLAELEAEGEPREITEVENEEAEGEFKF